MFSLVLGMFFLQQAPATASNPLISYPFGSEMNGKVHFSSGPHAFGNTQGLAIVKAADASGIDFAGGPDVSCGIPQNGTSVGNCGFIVRSMGEGDVIYAGLGDFGNEVAVKLITGQVIVYAHLFDFWPGIADAFVNGQTYHVAAGASIGHVGGTGISIQHTLISKAWPTHLHVEMRDGTESCTRLCLNFYSGEPLGTIGNPIGWEGISIGKYVIYAYHVTANPTTIYNYDGLASDAFSGGPSENMVQVSNFAYWDTDATTHKNTFRTGITTKIPSAFTGACISTSDCESIDMSAGIAFSGKGVLGGGAILYSNLPPVNITPTPGPSPTPPTQIGDSAVDIFDNTNYGSTQYGWDYPTNGWFNIPDYMNEKTSSIQLDSGWSVFVSKDINGAGTHKCIVSSYLDLSGAYYDDGTPMTDTISSVNVFHDTTCGGGYLGTQPGDTVTFWVDPTYWNTNWGVHDPFSGDLPNYLQNTMTSIGITPGWSAVLYRNPSLGEGFTCFTSSDSDLTNNTMNDGYPVNDNVDSVEIFHDTICGGKIHPPVISTLSTAISSYQATVTYNISGAAPGYSIHTDFGDGTNFDMLGSTVNTTATHDYSWGSYLISVTVKGTDGVEYPYYMPITVSPPPTSTPVPTVTPTPTPIPTQVTTTVNSFNANTGVLSYTLNWTGIVNNWNQCVFGDGPTQHVEYFGPQVNKVDGHAYPVGNYTFTCTVVGLNNNKYVQSRLNTMVGAGKPITQLPLVTVNAMVQPNRTVVFTVVIANAKSVNHVLAYGSGQGSVNAYGNGTKTFSKSYPAAGTYNVAMTVYGLNNVTYVLNQQLVIQ